MEEWFRSKRGLLDLPDLEEDFRSKRGLSDLVVLEEGFRSNMGLPLLVSDVINSVVSSRENDLGERVRLRIDGGFGDDEDDVFLTPLLRLFCRILSWAYTCR